MKDNILVSIIVPVYKVEKYIDRCIKSILEQTYKNIEVIFVDDGSPDNSGNICEKYKEQDKRIKVIHKENGGLSSARNVGIDAANGEYLCFVDSDDWISRDMVEHIVQIILDKSADIVSISYALTKNENDVFKDDKSIKVMNKNEALEFFFEKGMSDRISEYPICIKGIRKSLFENVRFPEGMLYEDYTTNIELIKKAKVYVKSNKICYYYFQGMNSIIRSKFKIKDMQLLEQAEKGYELVKNETENIQSLALQKKYRSYFSLLAKIFVYGFSEEISKEKQKEIKKELKIELRKSFKALFFSKMPISRKILLIMLCL